MKKYHTHIAIFAIAFLVLFAGFLQAKRQHSQAATQTSANTISTNTEATSAPTNEVAGSEVSTQPEATPAPAPVAQVQAPVAPVTNTPAPVKTVSKLQTATPAPAPVASSSSPKIVETPGIAAAPEPVMNCSGGFNTEFLCLINNYRAAQGLGRLSYDSALNGVAQSHATWMYQNSNMSHIGANGSTFYQRCASAGTTCYAENIARGFTSASTLFEAWRKSPAHNANMLGNYHSIGLVLVGTYSALEMR